MIAASVVFWLAAIVWAVYLLADRDGIKAWLPWLCAVCVGLVVFGSALRALHL